MTVFLVDDDPVFLKATSFQLRNHFGDSIQVQEFQTGEACVAALDQQPTLIVLDYYLDSQDPEAADGLATLKAIRAQVPNASVVMLSSQEKYGVAAKTIASGAFQYIQKDQDAAAELMKTIEQLRN